MNLTQMVNIFAASKGGVGKTLGAAVATQYLRAANVTVDVADADPQAPKLSKFKKLDAVLLPLIEGGQIKQSAFDPFFSHLIHTKNATLIDTGSGAFLPILKYMRDNRLFDLLRQAKKQLYLHVIVTSGPDKMSTMEGAIDLLSQTKGTDARIVIWQNELKGIPMFEGRSIEETDWYQHNLDQIAGVVKIRDYNNETYTQDIQDMIEGHLTYKEIMSDELPQFTFMRKSRINIIFTDIFADLDKIFKPQVQDQSQKKEQKDPS